jgi:AraC family L-rhamnose operon regulatory protein RhaS
MRQLPALFVSDAGVYRADSCEPLKAAAGRGELEVHALSRRDYPGVQLPEGFLPELCSVGCWDARGRQQWGLGWHRNEGLELTYVMRGSLHFEVDGQRHALRQGQLTVTRPWQEHRLGDPNVGSCRLAWLILDLGIRRPDQPWRWPSWLLASREDLQRLTTLLSHNEQPVWPGDAEVAQAFARLAGCCAEARPSETRLKLHINALIVALDDLLSSRRIALDERLASSRRTVELFLDRLPRHLAEPWTLAAMAAQCGLARSRFSHHCRDLTNLSPLRHLARIRVEAAAKMLAAEPGRSITDIALSCGFQSSQYFATAFRAQLGCAPRAWRERRTTRR